MSPSGKQPFDQEERPTGQICLACAGNKMLVKETAVGYSGAECKWCKGTGAMTPEQLRAWRDRDAKEAG